MPFSGEKFVPMFVRTYVTKSLHLNFISLDIHPKGAQWLMPRRTANRRSISLLQKSHANASRPCHTIHVLERGDFIASITLVVLTNSFRIGIKRVVPLRVVYGASSTSANNATRDRNSPKCGGKHMVELCLCTGFLHTVYY